MYSILILSKSTSAVMARGDAAPVLGGVARQGAVGVQVAGVVEGAPLFGKIGQVKQLQVDVLLLFGLLRKHILGDHVPFVVVGDIA